MQGEGWSEGGDAQAEAFKRGAPPPLLRRAPEVTAPEICERLEGTELRCT